MLLNDIGNAPDIKLKKINQYLETNYGFKITENIRHKDLSLIVEQIEDEIIQLKIQGNDARESPEISKRLMILEGIRSLREFAMPGMGGPEMGIGVQHYHQPEFEKVVGNLARYVIDSIRLGDDMEDAVCQAMKEYRSSRYRFPDEVVEGKVRSHCDNEFKVGAPPLVAPTAAPMGVPGPEVMEDEELEEKNMRESQLPGHPKRPHADPYAANVSHGERQRPSTATPSDPDEFTLQALDNPGLSLTPEPKSEVPMVRNPKTGRMEPDPFAAQAAARRKGIIHKESVQRGNLVKHLRSLLETEVVQAEVMMSAKKFSSELQEMVEKIGRLQNEDLPPVVDQMRNTYGMETASAFQTEIYGALQNVMDSLYTAKSQVDDAVGNMAETGQFDASVDMDKDISMDPGMDGMGGEGDLDVDADLDLDLDNLGDELGGEVGMDDEFGGAEEEEPLGREMKMESILRRKVTEMKRLVEKARKLKEEKEIEEAVRLFKTSDQGAPARPKTGAERNELAAGANRERAQRRGVNLKNPADFGKTSGNQGGSKSVQGHHGAMALKGPDDTDRQTGGARHYDGK